MPLRRTLMTDMDNQKGGSMDANTFDQNSLGFEAAKLLEVLLRHANGNGRAQVAASSILAESGLTQGALVRARGELVRTRLMRVESGFSASGLRGANVYVLNMAVIEPSSKQLPNVEPSVEEPSAPLSDLEAGPSDHRKPKRPGWKKFFGSSREA